MSAPQRYTPVPGFERESMRFDGTSRNSRTDLDNFYDGNVPAAHRLSHFSSHSLSPAGTPDLNHSTTNMSRPLSERSDRPFHSSQDSYSSIDKPLPNPTTSSAAAAAAAGGFAGYTSFTPRSERYSNPYEAGYSTQSQGMSGDVGMSGMTGMGGNRPGINQRNSIAYQNVPSETYWPTNEKSEPFTPRKSRKKLWWTIGIVLGVLAIVGIVVGVVVSQLKKSNAGGSTSGSSSSSSNGGNGSSSGSDGVLTNPNDPSVFTKDSRLHQSMWGIAYTPQGSIPPNCGAVQANVTRDIQLLSQLTTRIRLYSANCNVTALVLQAIKETKVDMTVWPAIYIDSDETLNAQQATTLVQAIKDYGTDHISGLTVGNEYILNTAGTSSTTSSTYLSSVQTIFTHIKSLNSTIQSLSLSKHLPIGTSDAGSIMSVTLGRGIDYFMANVHPFFGNQGINQAAAWTWNFFQEFDVLPASQASNKPDVFIAETGWPSQSLTTADGNSGYPGAQGDASLANLQTFLNTYVCQANANATKYFYFEAFDEPWKAQYGGVEPFWGVFDQYRNLKNLTIPKC